jgi:hypothetical protein
MNIPNDYDIINGGQYNPRPKLVVLFHSQPVAMSSDVRYFGYPVFRKQGKLTQLCMVN